jgi:hypothetical protein
MSGTAPHYTQASPLPDRCFTRLAVAVSGQQSNLAH